MKIFKIVVGLAAAVVLAICVYSFLLANGVFQGKFENDSIGWYFLAKGIFCSVVMFLLVSILEALRK